MQHRARTDIYTLITKFSQRINDYPDLFTQIIHTHVTYFERITRKMFKQLLSESQLRLDGRKPHELRRINGQLDVLSEPDGSALIQQGLTKVLVAVYGPHQTRGRTKSQHDVAVVNCQFSQATFATPERTNRSGNDRKSVEMSLQLEKALTAAIIVDQYPRSQIDVFFEVLSADGGTFCACINGATLALINAGIRMRDYVCACTATLASNTTALVDVSHLEEINDSATLTVVSMPSTDKVVMAEMTNRFHIDQLHNVLQTAQRGCRDIQRILDTFVREHTKRVGSTIGWSNITHKRF